MRVDRADGVQVEVRAETCLGTGLCTFYASATFDIGDDGRVVLADPEGDGATEIGDAAEACPSSSIMVRRRPEDG